jgi:hypothetical protein
MWRITVAWEPTISTLIQNCFAKCSFGIEDATEDDQHNNILMELQYHLDCPSNYDESLNADQLVPTGNKQKCPSQQAHGA